jgi:hypothetical protein
VHRSNGKGEWAKAKPMNCEEMLVDQVKLTKEASPGTSVWVYRNSVKALPVRFYVDFVFLGVT